MNTFTIPKIYDADGNLDAQWFVYYNFKHPETGKMKRFRVLISKKLLTKQSRYERALEIKRELKKKLVAGFNPFMADEKGKKNLLDVLRYVSRYKESTLSVRSGSTYKSVINIFIGWLNKNGYGKKPVEFLTRQLAEDYMDDMVIEENISNRTINNRISFLRAVCNFMVKKEFITVNPFNFVDYLTEHEPEITAFTKSELKLIATHLRIEHYQLYVISQLIFYCFIRPAELVRLQYRDIFWEHGIIVIPGNKSKNKRSEVIVLPNALKMNLSEWSLDHPSDYYLFSNGRKFTPGPKEIAPTRIAEAWRSFAKKHGITKNIYDLKHTGNGFAFDAGLSARDIQLQNRHHSLEQTQQYLNKFRRQAGDDFKVKFSGF